MSPKAQRIAIAEICGWREVDNGGWREPLYAIGSGATYDDGFFDDLPDYLNNLNPILAAVRAQENHIQWAIFTELAGIVDSSVPAATATAAQWSEAFLKAIGKWGRAK